MKYVSTRGGVGYVSFEDALFSGYASDGGLIVPENIPQVSLKTLEQWKTLSYPEIVQEVVSLFVTQEEIPREDLKNILERAFSRFDIEDVIKLVSFGDLNIAELWHGPTLAFKDLAMMCVGEFYEYFLAKRGKHVTVVVSTTGDTGSSAIEAVRGMDNVDIIVMLPYNRISKVQELMMTTVLDDNVHVFAGDGCADELEVVVKSLFADKEFSKKNNLCSINSINWARVMVQVAHHLYVYLQTANVVGSPVDIIIPTGACGNIAAASFTQAMGVPVKLVGVVNENDIVHRILRHNDLSFAPNIIQTFACAMDSQIPCNFERLAWIFCGKDPSVTAQIMESFGSKGHNMPLEVYRKMTENIRSAVVTDDDIVKTLGKCWEENCYLCCPHTCAGLAYYYGISRYGTRETTGTKIEDGRLAPAVCISTASIAKFSEVLQRANIETEVPQRIRDLFGKPTKFSVLHVGGDWELIIRKKIESLQR